MDVLKRLAPYLRAYRSVIILTLVLGALLSGLTVLQIKLVKFVTDIFATKDLQALRNAPYFIVGLAVTTGIVRFFHMFLLRFTGERIGFDIRNDLQARYAQLSLTFHGENTSGSLISKTTNDVINIQLGLSILSDVIKEPLTVVGVLTYLFILNWRLMCLTLVAAPLLIVASKSLGRSVRKYSLIQQKIFEEFTNVLKETLDGIRIVKAFALEQHMKDRFKKTTNDILRIRRTILKREEGAGPLFELLASVTIALIFYLALQQTIKGTTTQGSVVALVVGLFALSPSIKKLQDAHVRFQHTVAATQRIFEVLDTQIEIRDPELSGRAVAPWPEDWSTIKFEDVSFSYGTKKILDAITLEVKKGEVIAIVGASGAGKTTFVNLLPRFFDISQGAIKIGTTDIRDMQLNDLRTHIGLVTQEVFLFNESIRENIAGAYKNVSEQKINDSIQAAHATDFVEGFPQKLDTIVGERGSKLSGGERQRISIARALFKNAPILILDEATSSLDSQSEKIVQEALDELMIGRTTFVIAHRLSTIQKAHRIIVLADGKIVEEGSHAELLERQGLYHRLHSTQFSSILT